MKEEKDLNLLDLSTDKEEYEVYEQSGDYFDPEALRDSDYYKGASSIGFKNAVDKKYFLTVIGLLLWGYLANYVICLNSDFLYHRIGELDPTGVCIFIGLFTLQMIGLRLRTCLDHPVAHLIGYNLTVLPFGLLLMTLLQITPIPCVVGGVRSVFLGGTMFTAILFVAGLFGNCIYLSTGKTIAATASGGVVTVLFLLFESGIKLYALAGMIYVALFALYMTFVLFRLSMQKKSDASAFTEAFDVYLNVGKEISEGLYVPSAYDEDERHDWFDFFN